MVSTLIYIYNTLFMFNNNLLIKFEENGQAQE